MSVFEYRSGHDVRLFLNDLVRFRFEGHGLFHTALWNDQNIVLFFGNQVILGFVRRLVSISGFGSIPGLIFGAKARFPDRYEDCSRKRRYVAFAILVVERRS